MGKKSPSHAPYEEMKDTPWITQARQIADIGGRGVLDNYNKVNVFDDVTNKSIDARNNEIYKRAFDNMERAYTNTMNKYNAKNYGQFGTLNATAPAFETDNYQRDFQRQMNDLAYDQAVNYNRLKDAELQRRYNTLDMFNTLYGYGNTPYQLDLMNWNTRNTNKDIDYQNQLVNSQNRSGKGFTGALGGALGGGISGYLTTGNPFGAIAGAGMGAIGGML